MRNIIEDIVAFVAGVFVVLMTAGLLLVALVIVIPKRVIEFIRGKRIYTL